MSRPREGRRRRLARLLSRISLRLLAFNVLLVFLPAAGLLTLDTYERQLLSAQERSMVQQGRLLAATLSGGPVLDGDQAQRVLVALDRRLEARLRVVDPEGRVIADSAALGPRRDEGIGETAGDEARSAATTAPAVSPLYRVGSALNRWWRALAPPPALPRAAPGLYSAEGPEGRLAGPAVREALTGRYGADLRVTGGTDGAVTTLHSAIPILGGPAAEAASDGAVEGAATRPTAVVGAVLVSQSTGRVLTALREVRLGIFRVFLASVAAAVVLSLLVATTILRPIGRLRREAQAIVDRRGRLTGAFGGSAKLDEIGDLTRALEELTGRLRRHLTATEAFAADVSHEFKNPLAAIRGAVERLAEADDEEQRRRFERIVLTEVARLERLLSGVAEVSAVDAEAVAEPGASDVAEMVHSLAAAHRLRGGPPLTVTLPQQPLVVAMPPERFAQVLANLLSNAASFSPPGSAVEVDAERRDGEAMVA
ncbi:MAG TPA: histidine kinase dimerization/phospho-acceptor domain-containing protein, partial [Thermoanaerobaculia bacterium]|nr:histidine kinase dimerization/phospho-acceptor domain-containing protein [Thermoanaerobaculia bacterium]